jgi:RNA polymerase sigma-70 factor (ECF subfamily)
LHAAVALGTLPAMPDASPAAAAAVPADPRDRAADQLRRYALGDEAGFAELIADHQQAAFATAARILGDRDQAGDVVQEAFLRVLRAADRFEGGRPFRPWLLQIVRNLAIDCLRRRRRQEGVDRLAEAPAPDAPSDGERADLRARVALVLAELPEKYRILLVMRELEAMPAEDIAAQLALDYGTTRWRLHQARRLFRDAWCARFGGAPDA